MEVPKPDNGPKPVETSPDLDNASGVEATATSPRDTSCIADARKSEGAGESRSLTVSAQSWTAADGIVGEESQVANDTSPRRPTALEQIALEIFANRPAVHKARLEEARSWRGLRPAAQATALLARMQIQVRRAACAHACRGLTHNTDTG
jgi:hypothetical protein